MAISNLSEKIAEAEKERSLRYPLWDVKNNMEEIRIISTKVWEYCSELYPDMFPKEPIWEIVPRVVIEMMLEYFKIIETKTSMDYSEVSITVGNLIKIGIQAAITPDGHKNGTLNPVITVLEELNYDNDNPENNTLSKEKIDLNDVDSLAELGAKQAQNTMKARFGIFVEEWRQMYYIFVGFLRIARDYCISHKDDNEYGIEIKLADVVSFGIEKWGLEGESSGYTFFIIPSRVIKQAHAKNDEVTGEAVE